MNEPTIETITLSDGYRADVRSWRPDDPRGAALYFHGIQSHGGWYERSGSLLAEQSLTVLMPDRRGSGLNTLQRGHVASEKRCLDDAADLLDALLRQTGFPSAHVVGVSWGGKLAVALAGAEPKKVSSMTLIAPGLFPKVDLTTGEKFRVALAMLRDTDRMFDIPLNAARLFTANPRRIEFVENDGLKLTQVTASFLVASRRLDRLVSRFGESAWRGPVHLLLAGRDKIIDNERTRHWLRDLPSEDRKVTEYPDADHTIEFEADPSRFLEDLVGWIADHTAVGPPNLTKRGALSSRLRLR
ncbi:MAG: alpha/beta fold hydrolase [Phycisphaerae bacterium]|nr:alpha/beta fold hydrolase [Phycisphaerae bacterium]